MGKCSGTAALCYTTNKILAHSKDTAPGILSLYWNYDYCHLKNASVYLSSHVIRDPCYYPHVLQEDIIAVLLISLDQWWSKGSEFSYLAL